MNPSTVNFNLLGIWFLMMLSLSASLLPWRDDRVGDVLLKGGTLVLALLVGTVVVFK